MQVVPSLLVNVSNLMLRRNESREFNMYAEDCLKMLEPRDLVKLRDLKLLIKCINMK